ncbi:MAG: RES family NAD+ phosphorylase, partial [Rhizobiales bacterium]|nr:RES family NAD+ phosphorylase [Hyphomicrobiales bacterium]
GSLPETAAAELRPHTGEVACVADFSIAGAIRAVDLRNPRKVVSPFVLEGAGAISQLRVDIPFLERLGEELTRPVLPQRAAIDYIPSQYLCEFIKKCGYDGVVYRSSVSDGINLALFDPGRAVGGAVSNYEIVRVAVQVAQLA